MLRTLSHVRESIPLIPILEIGIYQQKDSVFVIHNSRLIRIRHG